MCTAHVCNMAKMPTSTMTPLLIVLYWLSPADLSNRSVSQMVYSNISNSQRQDDGFEVMGLSPSVH